MNIFKGLALINLNHVIEKINERINKCLKLKFRNFKLKEEEEKKTLASTLNNST